MSIYRIFTLLMSMVGVRDEWISLRALNFVQWLVVLSHFDITDNKRWFKKLISLKWSYDRWNKINKDYLLPKLYYLHIPFHLPTNSSIRIQWYWHAHHPYTTFWDKVVERALWPQLRPLNNKSRLFSFKRCSSIIKI